ncbi:MAG: mobile mystery protein B [Prevotellaceae bacterium]|jgi:Fic-DOC domain mobile mystery protein B|nr:mobile mystery protein B [Prevotellaceae bacterium]
MGLALPYIYGQTPLDADEAEGLLIRTISTRGELDEFEQQNIEEAMLWALNRSLKAEAILTEAFVREIHRRMFGNVWAWAGNFRKTNKNIGVDKWQVPVTLRCLLDDTKLWLADGIYPSDELAVRFKHRLVSIHCFPNGNGRHSRLMADIIVEKIFKLPAFTWGGFDLAQQGYARTAYLRAIKAADSGSVEPLVTFARS